MYYNEQEYKYLKEKNKREEPLGRLVIIGFILFFIGPFILGPLAMLILYFVTK